MKFSDLMFILLSLASSSSLAATIGSDSKVASPTKEKMDLALDFGLVLKNESGEPIGFQTTRTIPIRTAGQPSLYGLVVSKNDEDIFMLSSVHIVPTNSGEKLEKFLGKQMKVKRRGGIFMKTQFDDKVGTYQMEVYIDNVYFRTIEYELIDEKYL